MDLRIPSPASHLAADLQHRIDRKTKPQGALGRLEGVALQIGLAQGALNPRIERAHVAIFAGDHGAARAGISAFPQEVTWQMVENFLAGGAAINVFCRQLGLDLAVIDAGVNHDFGTREGLVDAKVARGTANYLDGPAMTAAQRDEAITRGRAYAHALAATGSNLVGFGEMGIGNTAAATLLTCCLAGAELECITGPGTGLDENGVRRKQTLLRQAMARGGCPAGALDALAEYGGFEIAMIAGAMLGAAEKRMIVLVDGFIVTSALLVAHRIAPQILPYCLFAHRSKEPGHAVQLDHLGVEPLMDLDLRLGEGTGVALAFPLVQASVNFVNEMASFDDAGVEGQLESA